ncbi:MAG TPA: Crp/Fnr family transcriptional regulator [Lacipirellulaceae bacterium]|nr:Crp/Fnr family transcriptional regulator [Lacipirellulaceae bacterium]
MKSRYQDNDTARGSDAIAPSERRALYITESLVEVPENPDFLGRLKAADRLKVIGRGMRRSYAPGRPFFRQGEKHDGIHVIETGVVRSCYAAPSGREITLAYWTPGHFVGGPEIFGGGEHMWSSIAVEHSHALWLPGKELMTLIRDIPDLALGLIEGLVHKGKCYSALLQFLGTKPMSKRLAHLLLTLAERHGATVGETVVIARRYTHEQLASMIGATRQWVSITFDRMEREGLAGQHNGCVVILDRSRLLEYSA